CARTPLLDFW
nr:immunoglobulin heavy chain junction region [Mus musculus]